MRLVAAFAALVPLCSTMVAANPALQWKYDCVAYDIANIGKDTVVWGSFADLTNGKIDDGKDGLNNWGEATQSKGSESREMTHYTYTLHGGLGKGFDPRDKNKNVFYVQADRTSGKGLGQQFRVNFHDHSDKIIASYWIYAQQACTIDPGKYTPDQIKRVSSHYAVY